MTGALKVFLIILQGSLCRSYTWKISMPQKIEGLTGSCVMVPCTFSYDSFYDGSLDASCKAFWNRGHMWGDTVFSYDLTGVQASNTLQGNFTGNLLNKECTTIFYNMQPSDSDKYFFRIQCDNKLKATYPDGVNINIQHSLDQPIITPSTLEVVEGTLVTLNCTAKAWCPVLPPALTWTPSIGYIVEKSESDFMVSVMNFTSSYLHNGQKLSCTALYKQQAGNSDLQFEKSLTLHVLYPPTNTSVSYPATVKEGSLVNLTCNSNGNPNPAVYTWYKVNGEQVTAVGSDKRLSTIVSEVDSQFYCKVSNIYGTQNSSLTQLDVQFPPKETTIIIEPKSQILEGSSVSLICKSQANPPVTNYTWYKGDEEEKEAGSRMVLNDVKPSSSGDYYCAAKNKHGDQNSTLIRLDIQYPPKNTSVSVDPSGPVQDRSSVNLTCTSIANPAAENITWFRVAGGEEKVIGSERDLTFNVSKLSEDQYYCEARNVHGPGTSERVSFDVTFAPEILTSSHCIKISSMVRCSCYSQGNPPPSLVWKLAGEPVNHSSAIPIREESLGKVGIKSIMYNLDEDTLSLVCLSVNSLGSDSFVLNMSLSKSEQGIHSLPIWIGFAVGALGMLLVCIPLLLICYRKGKVLTSSNKGKAETCNPIVTNAINSSKVDVIYANKAFLGETEVGEESLHYVNVDFAKLQAHSKGKPGEGEIRGLDSKTTEYAELRLQSRGNNEGDAKEEKTVADTKLEQKETP